MAAKGRKLSLLFALAALFASTSLFASIPRSEMLTTSSIDLRYESPSTSLADEDNSALLASALDAALPRPASLESLTETRVGVLDVLVPFEQQEAGELTRALRKAYDFPQVESVADATFFGLDPVNFHDPTGNARRTRNGGSNWLGDWGDETNGGIGAWAIAKNTIGNTLSEALWLDGWADAVYVANDSSRSVKQRAVAVGKGAGIAAVNLVGGEIIGTAGKVLLKVPGAKKLVEKVAQSGAGQLLGTDVRVLANRILPGVGDNIGLSVSPLSSQQLTQVGNIGTGAKPRQLTRMDRGSHFNRAQQFDYPHREVYIERSGGGYTRLDAYDPIRGEIVSRKLTQFGDIREDTALGYIDELATKYPVGARIANVRSSGPLAGQRLRGQLILEVPMQRRPISPGVLNFARSKRVLIRDVFGNVY